MSTGCGSNWVTQAVVGSPSSTEAGRSAGRSPARVYTVAKDELASTASMPVKAVTACSPSPGQGR